MLPPNELYLARLARLRKTMIAMEVPVLLVLDSINILYATGASNMTVFSTRTPARYLLLFAEGPAVLFDYFGCEHLAEHLPTIDRILPATGLCYVSSNAQVEANSAWFARQIDSLIRDQLGAQKELAVDRFPLSAINALTRLGYRLNDADAVFANARRRKLDVEIEYMFEAMARVENAVDQFCASIEPGKTEAEVWATFHQHLIAGEGQYVSTRLMQSGPNTFPYFQQCGARELQQGDLVCLDTDCLGFHGYAVDFSRTFLCGDTRPTAQQVTLYQRAQEQLDHNVSLIQAGAEYAEIADKAWAVPVEHEDSRYYCIAHGLGMSGEFPNIPHGSKDSDYPLSGAVEANSVLCVESYIGSKSSGQGVKLEQQLLVTEQGTQIMSQSGFCDQLQGR